MTLLETLRLQYFRELMDCNNCTRVLISQDWEVYDQRDDDSTIRYFIFKPKSILFTSNRGNLKFEDKVLANTKCLEFFWKIELEKEMRKWCKAN